MAFPKFFSKSQSSDANKITAGKVVDFVKTYEELKPFFALLVHCFKHIVESEREIEEKIKEIKMQTGQDLDQDMLLKELWIFRYACLHLWFFDLMAPKNETELSDELLVINSALKSVLRGNGRLEYLPWLKDGLNEFTPGELDINKLTVFKDEFSSKVAEKVTKIAFESTGGRLAGELNNFVIELFMTTMQKDKKIFHMSEETDLNEIEELNVNNLLTDLGTSTENEVKDVHEKTEEIPDDHNNQEDEQEYDIEKIDTADVSLAYKLLDEGVDVSDHLEKFTGEKSSKLALRIIESDSLFGVFNVASNISHFSKLSKNIAIKLIENDEAYCVGENIDKFQDLDQKVAELMIEHDESDVVLENIDKFSITNESRLALKIIDYGSSLGAFTVTEAFDKFTNLDQKVAERLIENDESYAVLENTNKFSLVDESRLALKVMNYDSDGVCLIVDNLDKFKNLSEQIASQIIKDKTGQDEFLTHSEELVSNLKSFTTEAQNLIKETYPTTI